MAVCVIGRESIVKADPDIRDSWVPESAPAPHDGPCVAAGMMTTIERIESDRPDAPPCEFCAWEGPAAWRIGGKPTCVTHVDDAYNAATRS